MKAMLAFTSPVPGQIRITDVQRHLDISPGMSIAVNALDEYGSPDDLLVRVTSQWCTKGFRPALECPSCGGPSRVLRAGGGRFACTKCTPRRLPVQQRKNTRDWRRGGGDLFDQLIREILRKDDSPEHQARLRVLKNRADALCRELQERAMRELAAIQQQPFPED